jgi:hypothetical protein
MVDWVITDWRIILTQVSTVQHLGASLQAGSTELR